MIDSGDAAEQTGVADSSEKGRLGQLNIHFDIGKSCPGGAGLPDCRIEWV